jgi:hypothetical protein
LLRTGRQWQDTRSSQSSSGAGPGQPPSPFFTASGQGVLAYPLFLRLLAGLKRDLYLIIEHLTLDDVSRARNYVLSQFDKI